MVILKQYLYHMLNMAVFAYMAMLFVYAIGSFLVRNRYVGWYAFLTEMVEPPLRWIRKLTQNRLVISQIDLSPIVLYFLLVLLQRLVYYLFFVV